MVAACQNMCAVTVNTHYGSHTYVIRPAKISHVSANYAKLDFG